MKPKDFGKAQQIISKISYCATEKFSSATSFKFKYSKHDKD